MNYEEDININENALDVEWVNQPALLLQYAQHSAELSKDYDETKQDVELLYAKLDKDIRENPENFGLQDIKITESVVKNAIITNEEYKDAINELTNSKYELDIAKACVSAIHMKKEALENLVRLHGLQYFAGPSIPRNLSKEVQKNQKVKQTESSISKKLNRRK